MAMPLGISNANAWLVGLELRVVGILKVVCVAIARGVFPRQSPGAKGGQAFSDFGATGLCGCFTLSQVSPQVSPQVSSQV